MDFFKVELLADLLGEAAKADISQKLTVFFVIWWFVRKTISVHFKKIEDGLALVAKNVSDLKDALTHVEQSHSVRLNSLENGMVDIRNRVSGLETKGP